MRLRGPGGTAAPDLSSAEAHQYRTRVSDAAAQRANFAGHYGFAVWGCGSGCETGAVVDHFTGRVTFLPFSVCCSAKLGEPGFEAIEFFPRSRLVVIAGQRNDEGDDARHFYEFRGGAFAYLKSLRYDDSAVAPAPSAAAKPDEAVRDDPHRGCSTIKDDRERLACYDGAPVKFGQASSPDAGAPASDARVTAQSSTLDLPELDPESRCDQALGQYPSSRHICVDNEQESYERLKNEWNSADEADRAAALAIARRLPGGANSYVALESALPNLIGRRAAMERNLELMSRNHFQRD